MKKHLFYTFLGVFVVTAIVTLFGVTGVITIKEEYLKPLVYAFLIESAGAVIALFRAAKFFDKETSTSITVTPVRAPDEQDKPPPPREERLPTVSPDSPPAAPREEAQTAAATDVISLHDLGNRYSALKGRFREQERLKRAHLLRRVLYRGPVLSVALHGVPGQEDLIHVYVNSQEPRGTAMSAYFPRALETDLFSLQQGDIIEVEGTLTDLNALGFIVSADVYRLVKRAEDQQGAAAD